jgi:hypothetical protein
MTISKFDKNLLCAILPAMLQKVLKIWLAVNILVGSSLIQAQEPMVLPHPGTMVNLSPAYEPAIIKGLVINKQDPFAFDFIIDPGQDNLKAKALKLEAEKMVKYFLAGLAIPTKDLWVNLSPFEKDRIMPETLSRTELGRDLLAEDYILKQLTASLIYPEKELGKSFWDKVYDKSSQMYGNVQIPVNTFNKVWIMADKAEVYEHNDTVYVVNCHLKVMLEEDYLALMKNQHQLSPADASSQIVKEIILPEIEKEVNSGKNFANLRQIFHAMILSSWYKKNLKQAILNAAYSDRSNVSGIGLKDSTAAEDIYQKYLEAYKKGVFNFIKEDKSATGKPVARKYFSGGIIVPAESTKASAAQLVFPARGMQRIRVGLNTEEDTVSNAMITTPLPPATTNTVYLQSLPDRLRRLGWSDRTIEISMKYITGEDSPIHALNEMLVEQMDTPLLSMDADGKEVLRATMDKYGRNFGQAETKAQQILDAVYVAASANLGEDILIQILENLTDLEKKIISDDTGFFNVRPEPGRPWQGSDNIKYFPFLIHNAIHLWERWKIVLNPSSDEVEAVLQKAKVRHLDALLVDVEKGEPVQPILQLGEDPQRNSKVAEVKTLISQWLESTYQLDSDLIHKIINFMETGGSVLAEFPNNIERATVTAAWIYAHLFLEDESYQPKKAHGGGKPWEIEQIKGSAEAIREFLLSDEYNGPRVSRENFAIDMPAPIDMKAFNLYLQDPFISNHIYFWSDSFFRGYVYPIMHNLDMISLTDKYRIGYPWLPEHQRDFWYSLKQRRDFLIGIQASDSLDKVERSKVWDEIARLHTREKLVEASNTQLRVQEVIYKKKMKEREDNNPSNPAAIVKTPGGINISTDTMKWNIRKDGQGVQMDIDPVQLERWRGKGINHLTPEIFTITPINVRGLLGLEPSTATLASNS